MDRLLKVHSLEFFKSSVLHRYMTIVNLTYRKLTWKKSRQDIGLRKIRWKTRFWGPFLCQRPRGTTKLAMYTHSDTRFSASKLMLTTWPTNIAFKTSARWVNKAKNSQEVCNEFVTPNKDETKRFRTQKSIKSQLSDWTNTSRKGTELNFKSPVRTVTVSSSVKQTVLFLYFSQSENLCHQWPLGQERLVLYVG